MQKYHKSMRLVIRRMHTGTCMYRLRLHSFEPTRNGRMPYNLVNHCAFTALMLITSDIN